MDEFDKDLKASSKKKKQKKAIDHLLSVMDRVYKSMMNGLNRSK